MSVFLRLFPNDILTFFLLMNEESSGLSLGISGVFSDKKLLLKSKSVRSMDSRRSGSKT